VVAELKSKLKLMPLHAFVMIFAAVFSFASIFIPMFQLYVQYVPVRNDSLFTLILSPYYHSKVRSGPIDLNFQHFAAWVFVVTIVLAVAALTLSVSYPFYAESKSKKKIGYFSVLALFIARGVAHVVTLSKMITEDMINSNNMTPERLYVAQGFTGNILTIVLFIGAVAALYGGLGLRMNYKLFAYPYIVWIVLFTILPLILIFFRAFFKQAAGGGYEFTTAGFKILFANKTVTTSFYGFKVTLQEYFSIFLRSFDYALWTTIGCLILGYPVAYILASRAKKAHSNGSRLLLLFVLPMWMNTMLRTYAWRAFFAETGVLNTMLQSMHLINEPVLFLKNEILADIVTKLVMTNDFLPFMILPIYTTLMKLDKSHVEAARDLGANGVQTFMRVVLPQSVPGIISGITMVFVPAMSTFAVSAMLGGGEVVLLGQKIEEKFLSGSPGVIGIGSTLAIVLIILVIISMVIMNKVDKNKVSEGGTLW
jgi:ABC-type spermidine/putrescine transport system permease subunit I